jgi:cobaltochelatase CobT
VEGRAIARALDRGGKPANPGRLNDLRHHLQSADAAWRRARKSLA